MLWCGCEWDPRAMLETLPLFGWSTSPTSTLRPISRSRFYYSSIYSAIVFPHMGQHLCSSAPHGPTVPSAATNSSTLCYSSHSPPVSHWVFGCGDSRHCPSPGPRARLSFPPSQGSSSLPESGSLQPWVHGSWVWELYESLVFDQTRQPIHAAKSLFSILEVVIVSPNQLNWIKYYSKWYSIQ